MNAISFGVIKARMYHNLRCIRAFFVQKLVQYSDIVNGNTIWYGNHTIFEKIKVYFIPYILCFLAFYVRICGGSPVNPAEKDEKDWAQWHIEKKEG